MLSTAIVMTMAGALASSAHWRGPAKPVLASVHATATINSGSIASAVGPLDLRKLTMSDFGDVEERR